MDLEDHAQELEQQQRDNALATQAAQGGLLQGDWRRLSLKWCEGPACGARIPDERRRAIPGVRLCVQCKARNEQEERLRR